MNIEEIDEGIWFEESDSSTFYFFEKRKKDGTQVVEIESRKSFLYIPFLNFDQAILGLEHIQWEPARQKPVNLDVKDGGTFFVDYCFSGEHVDGEPWHVLQVGYLKDEFQGGHNFTEPDDLKGFASLTHSIIGYFEERGHRFLDP